MKTLFVMLALAALMASPAVAQSRQSREPSYEQPRQSVRSGPIRHAQHQRKARRTPCVGYNRNGCLGWDPDPGVRMMLLLDANRDDE